MRMRRPGASAAVLALSLVVPALSAPLVAQTASPDSTRRSSGFHGPASSEATIAEDSKRKDPLVAIPFFDRWQDAKARVEESLGLTYGVSYQTMYSNASASIDGAESSSGGGIFSVTTSWTAFGK